MESSVYDGMTNFELMQLVVMHRTSLADDITLFVSILFGFLVVIYLVGSRLERFQLYSLIVLYSVFALVLVYGTFITAQTMRVIAQLALGEASLIGYSISAILFLSWVLSMVFCLHQRRNRDDT